MVSALPSLLKYEWFNDLNWFERSLPRLMQVKRTKCRNCLVWAKSDSLARDVIKLSGDTMVKDGYSVALPCFLFNF